MHHIITGGHQGDVLVPKLFALFINDFSLELKFVHLGVSILHYADDIAVSV